MPDETFRQFYERTTGHEWPGHRGEMFYDVVKRVMNAVADWCDELAKKPRPLPEGSDFGEHPSLDERVAIDWCKAKKLCLLSEAAEWAAIQAVRRATPPT